MRFFEVKSFVLNLLFPKSCFGCGKSGGYVCEECKSGLLKFRIKRFGNAFYAFSYSGLIKKLILQFKYKFAREIEEVLGKILILSFEQLGLRGEEVFVVPVPTVQRSFRQRGFNQTEVLAWKVAGKFGKVDVLDCLSRKDGKKQAELSKFERLNNLEGNIFFAG